MQLPEIGVVFHQKYQLEALLGEGGFARVYRARDLEVGRLVAIKALIPGTMGYDPQVERRFTREAKVIAELQHPNTITMFEFGRTTEGLLFMVFEYAEGRDLSQLLAESGPLPPPVVAHILEQILGALGEAHDRQLLHRDLKPANVIVFEYMGDLFRVKLIDFGIAKPLVERLGEPNTLTSDGVVVGTPRYMAPEQFFGEQLTPAADVYSLGLVAYEMLTGSPAIDGPNQSALIKHAVSRTPIRVPASVAPPGLRGVIDRMLVRVPQQRFPNATSALRALGEIGEVASSSTESGTTWDEHQAAPSAPARSRFRYAIPGALVALVAGVAAALAVVGQGDEHRASQAPPQPQIPNALVKVEGAPHAAPRAVVEDREPRPDMARVTDGCGVDADTGRVVRVSARVGVNLRTFAAYAPREYDEHRRHPIVLVFHRTSREAERVLYSTQFPAVADDHKFFLIAMQALDPSKPWTSPDDVDAVEMAIERMSEAYCLDRTQVFAVGDGAGGRFVANLPCQRPLSGTATFAYGQYEEEQICVPQSGPVPHLRAVGAQDRDVPNEGGAGCVGGRAFIDAAAHERFWRNRQGCRGKKLPWAEFEGGACRTWACDVSFVACDVDGGHIWPGSQRPLFTLPRCDAPIGDFPLADAIWQFFYENGRTLHP